MSGIVKYLKFLLVFLAIVTITACAPSRKNSYYQKKKKSSQVSSSQLGRNRYYFSPGYQKKLNGKFKK